MSVWLIDLYGGIGMKGEGPSKGDSARVFGAMTARQRVFDNAARIIRFAL
jgi:hypothetical protein